VFDPGRTAHPIAAKNRGFGAGWPPNLLKMGYHHRTPTPPATPPSLGEAMHMVAKLGGFVGRKGDGHPGTTVLWRGLDKLAFITDTYTIFLPALPAGP